MSEVKNYLEVLNQEGYVIIPSSVKDSQIDLCLESYSEIKKTSSTRPIKRLANSHFFSTEIRNMFTCNSALETCDLFFEKKTCIYTSLFYEAGSEQEIHRDSPYFRTEPINNFLGMWVALEDANEENGSLKLYEKGHLLKEEDLRQIRQVFYSSHKETPDTCMDLWTEYQDRVEARCIRAGLDFKILDVKKGDTVLWHPMLPHGGSEIIKPGATRNSIVFHVTPEDVPVYRARSFFNPEVKQSPKVSWKYLEEKNRKFAYFRSSATAFGLDLGKLT